jgi:hypothetical protein
MTISELLSFAFGIKTTGDADVTAPSYTDAQIQTLANTVQSEIGSRASDPRPSLTKQEQQDVDTLCRAIMAVKSDVEKVANLKAQGNRSIFEKIVRRTGFVPKDVYKKHSRVFESKPTGKGSFHVWVPSAGKGVNYYYQYGIAPSDGVPPAQWENSLPLSTTELIVNGLKSGILVAVRYAALMHPRHTKKTTGKIVEPETNGAVSKVLNIPTVNNKGKVTYTHGTDFLHYSDIIYILIP